MTRGYREERWGVDPLGRYPANYPSRVERNAQRVLELLPDATVERTRDAIQLDWGGQHGLVVLVTADAFEFRLPTVEWPHPHEPAAGSRLWRRRSAAACMRRSSARPPTGIWRGCSGRMAHL